MVENIHTALFVSEIDTVLPPAISNEFGKYTNIRKLTQGGKATLHLAKDTNLGREVVIKRLRPELRGNKRELRRLVREARITAQLQHPGSVPIYEIGRDSEGHWYFAMKRIVGFGLHEILSKLAARDAETEARFPISRLLDVFLQVCDTLAYAHACGIIHRDLKPDNVVVGNFGEVILLDWGVAKVWGMPNEGDEDTIRERGGTPLYMSPEQVLGHYYVDERSDVFGMGVVLYELLTLNVPFRGRQLRSTYDQIINDDPIPPSEMALRNVPSALDAICMKALAKEPNDRYRSMAELVGAIERFRADAIAPSE